MGFCLRFGPQIPLSEQQVAGKFPTKTKQGINSREQGTAIEQQGSAPDSTSPSTEPGSGSTLRAAQATGRVCRGVEIDPLDADVIVRRFEAAT